MPKTPNVEKQGLASQRGEVQFTKAAEAQAQAPPQPIVPKVVPSPRRDTGPLAGRQESPTAAALTEPSPPPAATFLAFGDLGVSIPADTTGAAGPDHLLVALNSIVAIQNRQGQTLTQLRLDNFWKSLNNPSPPSTFDPKVLYDRFEKRWIIVSSGDAESSTSSLLVGVSKTEDPTAGWNLYRVDVDPDNQFWFDYPSVGFNKNWIVVQGNMFPIGNQPGFRSHIYVFDKADLYAGGSGKFTLLTRADLGLTQAPEVNGDNSESLCLVENVTEANNKLKLYKITGTVNNPELSAATVITAPGGNTWGFGPSLGNDFSPQKGTSKRIQDDDARLQALVSRNGLLWCVQTVFLPAGNAPTRCAIQWWQLDPNAANPDVRIKQFGRIDDPTGKIFRAYPSVAVNKNEDVLIGYSHFAGSEFASCAYSFRRKSDPPNALRNERLYRTGRATYFKTFGGTENRWGDYSNTVVDPNDHDFWTIQVFADRPTNHYGTQWAQVKPPS